MRETDAKEECTYTLNSNRLFTDQIDRETIVSTSNKECTYTLNRNRLFTDQTDRESFLSSSNKEDITQLCDLEHTIIGIMLHKCLISLSISVSVCLSVSLCLSVCLSICQSISVSVCIFLRAHFLSVSLSVTPFLRIAPCSEVFKVCIIHIRLLYQGEVRSHFRGGK